MPYRNIDSIVWDLDGTLVDSAPDLAAALNTLLQDFSLPRLGVRDIRKMIGNGVAKLVERGFAACGQAVSDDQMASLLPQFMSIYTKCATDQTATYPGARKALQRFQDAGIRQAICTNKPEFVSRQIIESLVLSHYFDILIGGDTSNHKKPHIEPLQACLTALRSTPRTSILIGDSAVDVAAARALGMPVAIVTHGYAREPHDSLGADLLISDLSSLPNDLGLGASAAVVALC